MDILRELLANGFMIYPSGDKHILKKDAVPHNPLVVTQLEFSTYEAAIDAAATLLNSGLTGFVSSDLEWTIIIRYNRGLGIEYRNLPTITAKNREDAQKQAKILADGLLDELKDIREIKVQLKNM